MYASITVKLLLGSALVFVIIRLVGKKAEAELTPFDLVYFLVLGGLLETAIYDPDITIWNVFYALLLWGGLVYFINFTVERTFTVSKILQGEPAILIKEGNINREVLKKNQIELEQLRAMLRKNGCFTLRDVEYAILEIDGQLSIIRKGEKEIPSILLIDEGRIDEQTLESLDFDKDWLLQELKKEGYHDIEAIHYCEWIPEEGLHVAPYEQDDSTDMKLDG